MARFRGTAQGTTKDGRDSTEAARLGAVGIETNANGWDLGVQVVGYINDTTGRDEFEIWTTGGSNASKKRRMIGTLTNEGFMYAPPPR